METTGIIVGAWWTHGYTPKHAFQ